MSNLGKYNQITFEVRDFLDEKLLEFLEDYFEVLTCNYTDEGGEEYVGYADVRFDEESFLSSAKALGVELVPYKVELLENKDWLRDNVIEFEPIETDRFLIYGVHEKEEPKTNKIPVRIYAATAFGSGHQTTLGCLKTIENLEIVPEKVLDVGCGSGILSIASAKLWKDASVVAVDIDEESVLVTLGNAKDNGVELRAELSDGYSNPIIMENAPYDVILSNILARPLIEMAEDLAKNLKQGGYVVLSGFVDNQVDWVVGEHEKFGLKLVKIFEIENWRAVLMEKK